MSIAIASGIWWWSHREATPGKNARNDRNRPVTVAVEQVDERDVPVSIQALGTIVAHRQATVRSRIDGLIESIDFAEGSTVHEGQILAHIDPRPFQAALSVARGQLAKDTAQLEAARIDLQRYRKLLSEDSIASQTVDTQTALVKQLEGVVATDQGNVTTAELNLSFTSITAPISGVAGLRQVDQGNMIHASDANGLVVLTETHPIEAVFAIPQENLPLVLNQYNKPATREKIMVDIYGRDGTTLIEHGKLLAIDNQTDTTTGSVKFKAQFANDTAQLFPGQFVNVRLIPETLPQALTLSQSAIQRGTAGTFVYLVSADKTVAVRQVRLGPVIGERVVILAGLAAKDTIVIDGADKLREGSSIMVIDKNQEKTGVPTERQTAERKQNLAEKDGSSPSSAPQADKAGPPRKRTDNPEKQNPPAGASTTP